MKTEYIITANDSVEAICLGTEADSEAMKRRMKATYEAGMKRQGYSKPNVYLAARKVPLVIEHEAAGVPGRREDGEA